MRLKFLAAIALAATLYSCDDTTTGIGDFVADADEITASAQTFEATTKTLKYTDLNPDGVFSRTSNAYLGKFTDPDFGTYTADFITQINCTEDFEFPETMQDIVSTTLVLYYSSFYGDSLAPMRVRVDMLNQAIDDTGEDLSLYYTSYNPENFYNKNEAPLAEQDYAARNNLWTDAEVDSIKSNNVNKYYPPLMIDLDKARKERGEETMSAFLKRKYQENKNYFKDAYSFIHNVIPGFYIHNTSGEGSILYIGDIWLQTKVSYLVERPSTGKVDSWFILTFLLRLPTKYICLRV